MIRFSPITMKILKLGDRADIVKILQKLLGIKDPDGIFGSETDKLVKEFQGSSGIVSDGVVGRSTWISLYRKHPGVGFRNDYEFIAFLLDTDSSSILAVKKVETGGRSGFIAPGKPSILFEGHIFWKLLGTRGIKQSKYLPSYQDVLYKNWTTKYYLGGIKEYTRLEKASKIDRTAALESASWGQFQILGMNYKLCGCKNVDEFVGYMKKSELDQLILFSEFIRNQKNLYNSLKSHSWSTFARYYNGPGYKSNKYDIKLKEAYDYFKNKGL